jgi:hypothetical protein
VALWWLVIVALQWVAFDLTEMKVTPLIPLLNSVMVLALIFATVGIFEGKNWARSFGAWFSILNGVVQADAGIRTHTSVLFVGVALQGVAAIVLFAARREFETFDLAKDTPVHVVGRVVCAIAFVGSIIMLLGSPR